MRRCGTKSKERKATGLTWPLRGDNGELTSQGILGQEDRPPAAIRCSVNDHDHPPFHIVCWSWATYPSNIPLLLGDRPKSLAFDGQSGDGHSVGGHLP